MPKKFDDYYDYDNKVQYKPQTWECPKCQHQIQVLSAKDVSHQCPKNDKKATFYKNLTEQPVKKVTNKVIKKVSAKKVTKKIDNKIEKEENNEISR